MKKEIMALDIGGTNIRVAIVKKNKILKIKSVKTPKDKKEFLKIICSLIDGYLSKKIKGIGIGFPSIVKNGVIKNSVNVPLKNFDLKSYLEKKYKKNVEIMNDATCVANAELKVGCKKKNFLVFTLGTGIGGGVIINGKIFQGEGAGGEIGHIYVRGKDFESFWKNTKKQIKKQNGKEILIKDLVKMKDAQSKRILMESADYLGEGIGSIVTVLDPEIVIIGGGIKESGQVFIKMIEKNVQKYSFIQKKTKVEWSKINEPGIIGASLLIQ